MKRYLKLKVQEMGQNTNTPSSLPKNGNPAAILVGTNGIKFKVKGAYYTFEQ